MTEVNPRDWLKTPAAIAIVLGVVALLVTGVVLLILQHQAKEAEADRQWSVASACADEAISYRTHLGVPFLPTGVTPAVQEAANAGALQYSWYLSKGEDSLSATNAGWRAALAECGTQYGYDLDLE